jgi:hypothetical protein
MVSIDENVKFPLNYDIFEENKYVSKITHQFIYFKTKIVRK